MLILVTGGAGYIGSHTCVELLRAGHGVVILDNLYNSKASTVGKIAALGGSRPIFYEGDMRDRALLDKIFAAHRIGAAIHFAALKAPAESAAKPLEYYGTNLHGTITLLEAMRAAGCRAFVFSSSATVYGGENFVPFREDMPIGKATNPYGNTKIIIEEILGDLCAAEEGWNICLLRYFNPVGAHPGGLLGDDPKIPENIMPIICHVAQGKQAELLITGTDFDTPDGTCLRDYIHVVDLARGHLKALDKTLRTPGCEAYNLGTGKGLSVLELVAAFERASGVTLPKRAAPRRPGNVDIPRSYADVSKAERELGWRAEFTAEDMCRDVWNYLQKSQDLPL
ncbi:MAG: UDP-glucose 4-epimerase GalE [Oscillospiraceae bacterium]|jgi:UDP-glucose 4-epimerase|nr:UDP-glucose 4-epimerase GalE [Oscillospiraceae bacterium]